jgi:hypothetical protein
MQAKLRRNFASLSWQCQTRFTELYRSMSATGLFWQALGLTEYPDFLILITAESLILRH